MTMMMVMAMMMAILARTCGDDNVDDTHDHDIYQGLRCGVGACTVFGELQR